MIMIATRSIFYPHKNSIAIQSISESSSGIQYGYKRNTQQESINTMYIKAEINHKVLNMAVVGTSGVTTKKKKPINQHSRIIATWSYKQDQSSSNQ